MPITLGFGKYGHMPIEKVPHSYLIWGEQNLKGLSHQRVKDELQRREAAKKGIGVTTKLSQDQFAEELAKLLLKYPEGIKDQTLQYAGFEIKIRRL